jgi:hypothetical protein
MTKGIEREGNRFKDARERVSLKRVEQAREREGQRTTCPNSDKNNRETEKWIQTQSRVQQDPSRILLCTLFLLFLSVAFTSSFTFPLKNAFVSLSLSPPTVDLSLSRLKMHSSLCRIHLRLLLFHFLALKCVRLFFAFTSDCCSFTF